MIARLGDIGVIRRAFGIMFIAVVFYAFKKYF